MPTKNRAKLILEELQLIRTARENGALEIPADQSFADQVRRRASHLMKMAGLDVSDRGQLLLVAAIVFDQLTKNSPAGRPRGHNDNDEFDLLERFTNYRTKHSKLKSNVVARVTNGLCLFDARFAAYKAERGPERLRKRFERAWQRLRDGKMKKLDARRRGRRVHLLENLDRRFRKLGAGD